MSEFLPDPDPAGWPGNATRWIRTLPAGTPVARIYPTGGEYPVQWYEFRHWGPTASRFDHHPEPTRHHRALGVMYGAIGGVPTHDGEPYPAFTTTIVEYYQKTRTVVPEPTFDWAAAFTTTRPLSLLDLGDTDWVTVAGGNAAIHSGPQSQSRTWARAIHRFYPHVDGLVYPSSVAPPGRAIALWERAHDAVPEEAVTSPLTILRAAVENAAHQVGYGVLW